MSTGLDVQLRDTVAAVSQSGFDDFTAPSGFASFGTAEKFCIIGFGQTPDSGRVYNSTTGTITDAGDGATACTP